MLDPKQKEVEEGHCKGNCDVWASFTGDFQLALEPDIESGLWVFDPSYFSSSSIKCSADYAWIYFMKSKLIFWMILVRDSSSHIQEKREVVSYEQLST